MKISKQSQRGARQLFRSCLVDNLLDEARARRVVALLLEKKPRGYLEILTRFQRLVQLNLEQHAASVESAAALPADLQNTVAGQIKSKYGPSVAVTFSQNPALLGGLRIQVGSDLYDGSVKTRLDKLQEAF